MARLQEYLAGSRRNYAIAVASIALLIAIAVAVASGFIGKSGTSETFTASSFVDAANKDGAGLVLGQKLISSQKDVEIYGISFDKAGLPGAGTGDSGDEHGGASLTVSPDSDAAIGIYQQCEGAGNFTCYRANNVSLVFDEGTDPHVIAKVDAAIRALGSG